MVGCCLCWSLHRTSLPLMLGGAFLVYAWQCSFLQVCSTAVGAAPALLSVQVGWSALAPNHESDSSECQSCVPHPGPDA